LAFIRSQGGVRRIVRIDYIPANQRWQRGDHIPRTRSTSTDLRRLTISRSMAKHSGKTDMKQDIPGTIMFDGEQAQKGLALNRMCFSFNNAENRSAFLKDEDGYCAKYGLNDEQRAAVKSRNVLLMIEAGGNVYYLAKLAGIFGLNVQDIGAQQTNTTVDQFKAKLVAAGR
jgi:protocatechuate 4,5-dioxygenase, alpha chain